MENRDWPEQPRFYFSLPRLIVKLRGGNARRCERSWAEANIVGTMVHAIVFVFAWRLLLADMPASKQMLLLLPVIVLVLLSWSTFFYLSTQLLWLVRLTGLFRGLSNFRIHSVIIGIIVTAFAWQLVLAGSWMRALGLVWIAAVLLNHIAAALLAVTHADQSSAK